jgi:uncharacterized protein YbjT (DUF2867 family)
MRDAGAFGRAVDGASAVYHIAPNMSPDELTMGRTAVEAARRAQVRRFVYHSVLHPQTEAMPHHWQKLRVEELLLEAELAFTILQPAAYMQNILGYWDSISREGLYRVPYPPETRLNMVDLADVAEVAARVLCEPGHEHATYELAGPENLTQAQVAAVLSRCLGRDVRVEEIPLESWSTQAAASGLGRYQVSTLVAMFRYYARYGFCGNARVLTWLLGRPPMDFATFVCRQVAGYLKPA